MLALVFASFAPQFRLVSLRKDATGISLAYLLGNLICSTEHFFLVLLYPISLPIEFINR